MESLAGQQQQAILAAITAIKDQLDAIEWRHRCLWVLASVNASAQSLGKRIPGSEQSFKNWLEALDCHANLVFKSPQDLRTVFTCFTLIAEMLEEAENGTTVSFTQLGKQISCLIDELEELERGDPHSLLTAQELWHGLQPRLREAERVAVRQRFEQRLRDGIKNRSGTSCHSAEPLRHTD
jgi:hypothetical protein